MRTGLRGFVQPQALVGVTTEKILILMQVLMEEALKTAARFTLVCGRTTVTDKDVCLGLKTQARDFFDSMDWEERYFALLNGEQSEEENDECSDGEGGEGSDGESSGDEEVYSTVFSPPPDIDDTEAWAIYLKVLGNEAEWEQWQPDDPLQMSLKRAIDTAESALNLQQSASSTA